MDEIENTEYVFSFEKLLVWNDTRDFITEIYELTDDFPFREGLGLSSQIQRTAASVAANIAEGTSGFSKRFYAIFTNILRKSDGNTESRLCSI